MGVQVLTPGIKPGQTNISRARVSPEWRWAWRGLHIAWPLWENAANPRDVAYHRHSESLSTGWSWDRSFPGTGLAFDATTSGADVLLATNTDTSEGALSQPPFSAVVVINNAVDGGSSNTILANRDRTSEGFSSGGGWVLKIEQFNNTGVIGFTKIRASDNSDLTSSLASPFGEFAVIGVTLEADNNIILYLDGTADDLGDTSAIGDPTDYGITLGGLYASGSPQELTGGDYLAFYGWDRALTSVEHQAIARDPFGPFRPQRRVSVLVPAAGQTVTVGLATETDTAFGVGAAKNQSVGLASETDSGLGVTAQKTVTVGLSLETDTSFGVTAAKDQAVGLASESDTALSVATAKVLDVGLATEADSALAVAIEKVVTAGLASETDTAFAVSTGNAISVGLATEADSAFGVSVAKQLSVGLASETDAALVVVPAKSYPAGLASETDSAFTVDLDRAYAIGLATESDSALAVSIAKALSVGLATETDTALAVIVVGAELDLRPPFTAAWIDRERNALWIDRERVAEWEDRERDAEWEQ